MRIVGRLNRVNYTSTTSKSLYSRQYCIDPQTVTNILDIGRAHASSAVTSRSVMLLLMPVSYSMLTRKRTCFGLLDTASLGGTCSPIHSYYHALLLLIPEH